MRRLFQRLILARPWLTFIVMSLSFLMFGIGTLNLIDLLQANATFIAQYGWLALMQGALLQLAELLATGALSMAAYVVFRACEQRLADWLTQEH